MVVTVNKFILICNKQTLFSGSERKAEAVSSSDPSRVRDHSASLDQEGLPTHQQPQQQRVQGLQDWRQKEAQCTLQGNIFKHHFLKKNVSFSSFLKLIKVRLLILLSIRIRII